jgi:hypothetical protein
MKKIVALLVIVAVAAPAMAATTVTCAQIGSTAAFTVSYAYTTGTSFPRAFALDITTSKGSFSSVTPTISGESLSTAKGFGIFPGTIIIDTAGVVTTVGTPVAPQSDLPAGTLAGLGTAGMTVELGSLYAVTAAKPVDSAVILTVAMSGLAQTSAVQTANITIAANSARGGLVLEDASTAAVSSSCVLTIPALNLVCKGDVNVDTKVTFSDVVALVGKLNTYGGKTKTIPSSNTNYSLAGDANVDLSNTFSDVVKIVGWLNSYGGKTKTINCPHTYN